MNKKELLIKEIKQTPEKFLFVHFLQNKEIHEKCETALACESALKRDWLRPEEDEAWANL